MCYNTVYSVHPTSNCFQLRAASAAFRETFNRVAIGVDSSSSRSSPLQNGTAALAEEPHLTVDLSRYPTTVSVQCGRRKEEEEEDEEAWRMDSQNVHASVQRSVATCSIFFLLSTFPRIDDFFKQDLRDGRLLLRQAAEDRHRHRRGPLFQGGPGRLDHPGQPLAQDSHLLLRAFWKHRRHDQVQPDALVLRGMQSNFFSPRHAFLPRP